MFQDRGFLGQLFDATNLGQRLEQIKTARLNRQLAEANEQRIAAEGTIALTTLGQVATEPLKSDPQQDAAAEVTNTILTTLEQAGFGATAEGLPEIQSSDVPGLQTEAGRQAIQAAADATTPPGLAEALAMKALPAEAEARELLEAAKKKKGDTARIIASLPKELQPAGVVALNAENAGITASTTNLLVDRMIAQLPPDKRTAAQARLDAARAASLEATARRTNQIVGQDANAERAGAELRTVFVDDGVFSQAQADGLSDFQLGTIGQKMGEERATQSTSPEGFFRRMAGTLAVATTTDFAGNVQASFTPAQVGSRAEQLTRLLHPEFTLEGLPEGERAIEAVAIQVGRFSVGVTGADFVNNDAIEDLAAEALLRMNQLEEDTGVSIEAQLDMLEGQLGSKLELSAQVDKFDRKLAKLFELMRSQLR